jgi:FtsH-binding integral membrane protein
VLGAVGLTAAGTQYSIIPTENPGYNLLTGLGAIGLIFIQGYLPPGIPKYIVFVTFILLLSQILRPLEDRLQEKGLLFEVTIMTLGIFIPMVILGFYDRFNILHWGYYLLFALIGLIIARIVLYALALTGDYTGEQISTGSKLLSTVAIALFGLFTTWDVNLIREKAKRCDKNPDYVDSSMGLFLDLINLFTSSADILSE